MPRPTRAPATAPAITFALLAAAFALAAPAIAHASPKHTVSGTETLDGDVYFDELTIPAGTTLDVTPFTAAGTAGALRIHANTITIAAGGRLRATGAGCATTTGSDPRCTGGAGQSPPTAGHPGGGGGLGGKGGTGAQGDCSGFLDAAGGDPVGASLTAANLMGTAALATFPLGRPGGAANVAATATSAGARGGGTIVLEAATIVIDGAIEADGDRAYAQGGVSPGGGSGGLIVVLGASVKGAGTLSAAGGAGDDGAGDDGVSPPIDANHGGGGGGGVILIASAMTASTSLVLTASGGLAGTCTAAILAGASSTPTVQSGLPCIDADGDGHPSQTCGGDDCDDGDPSIHPGATELCNGIDEACNGNPDQGANLCPAGLTCTDGACIAAGQGGSGSGGGKPTASPAPGAIAFQGGCTISGAHPAAREADRHPREITASLLGAAVFALGLRVRQRRRDRSRTTA